MSSVAPFSLKKGYPFLLPMSIEDYPLKDRIGDIIHIENEQINMTKDLVEKKFGLEAGVDQATFDKAYFIGMTDRVLVAEHALAGAENQIIDMMKDMPFVPENFGFEAAIAPENIQDAPITIFKSKLMSGVLLTRVVGENNKWIVMQHGTKVAYNFTSERVAVCVFYALGIPMPEQEETV